MEKKFIYTKNYRNIEKTIYQKKIKNENKVITCHVNIPLEVIYGIVQQFILPFRPNQCIYNYNVNRKDYFRWLLVSKDFYKMNKILYHPLCFNHKHILFENKYWCSLKNEYEYNIAETIKNKLDRNTNKIYFNKYSCPVNNKISFEKVHYLHKNEVIPKNISNSDFYKLVNIVLKNTQFEITHSCCDGKGIGYSVKS